MVASLLREMIACTNAWLVRPDIDPVADAMSCARMSGLSKGPLSLQHNTAAFEIVGVSAKLPRVGVCFIASAMIKRLGDEVFSERFWLPILLDHGVEDSRLLGRVLVRGRQTHLLAVQLRL